MMFPTKEEGSPTNDAPNALKEERENANLTSPSPVKSVLHDDECWEGVDPLLPNVIRLSKNPTVNLGVRIWRVKLVDHVDGSFFARLTLYFSWVDSKNVGIKAGTYVGFPIASNSSDGIKSHMSRTVGGSAESGSPQYPDSYSPTPRFENSSSVEFDKDQALQPITVDDRGTTKLVSPPLAVSEHGH